MRSRVGYAGVLGRDGGIEAGSRGVAGVVSGMGSIVAVGVIVVADWAG